MLTAIAQRHTQDASNPLFDQEQQLYDKQLSIHKQLHFILHIYFSLIVSRLY